MVLLDEYDKPLIGYLDDEATIAEHRDIMKSFYSTLKGQDANIRLLFLTE